MYLKLKVAVLFSLFFAITQAFSQSSLIDKITLKTGENYYGEIVLQNEDIILLRTSDGQRFQFPIAEILKVEKTTKTAGKQIEANTSNTIIYNDGTYSKGNVCGIVEVSGGMCQIKNKTKILPYSRLSILFGTRKIKEKDIFIGAGIGYFNVFSVTDNISYLPVFLGFKSSISNNIISPFVGLDTGYSFALSPNNGGGTFAKIATGINYKINSNTTFNIGISIQTQTYSGSLTETTEFGPFNYKGTSSIQCFGLNAGLQF